MKHLFLDTNVLIDLLAQREGFWLAAAELVEAGKQKRAVLYVASLSFSHIHYVLRKSNPPAERRDKLLKLTRLVQIVAIGGPVVEQALASDMSDFEDALQYFAARSIPAISYIVTRDPKGFAGSQLPVVSPVEALVLLG